jgi:dihydrofolate reductase
LKQGQGNNILIGGGTILSHLTELGLVDEYRFVVSHRCREEVVRRCETAGAMPWKLVESKIFKSGWVALRYLKTVTEKD